MSIPDDAPLTPPPLSRREAREAAERATTPVDAASASAAAEASKTSPDVVSGPVSAASPVASSASIAQDVPMTPADADVPPARSRREESAPDDRALTDMADLFAAAPDEARIKKQTGRKRRTGCLVWLVILVVIAGGLTAAGVYVNNVYGEQIREKLGMGEPKDYDSSQVAGEETTVTIADGDTGGVISQSLFDAGVTKTPDAFYDYLLSLDTQPSFFPGAYRVQTKLPSSVAAAQLADPARKMENTVLIREGETAAQIYPALATALGVSADEVAQAAADPAVYGVNAPRLEGWLFPATYTFDEGTTPQQAIQTLVDRTRQSLANAQVPEADQERILNIASIIQREAREGADLAKVSRVIQNRLDQGMKLQMDSTAQYGYGQLHAGTVSSSQEALDDVNDWNTYQITGLPATPISNPGDAAIDAAMHPADGPWLYFVTVNLDTGETIFNVTYEDHLKSVDQWQQWCKDNPDGGC